MEIFYRLSSLFALESFLSSEMYHWKHCLERGISIPRDFFFSLGSNAKSQKWQKEIQVLQPFRAMQYMSLILSLVLKSPGLANEAD